MTMHMRDHACKRWLREHPESAADGIVVIGFLMAALAIWLLAGCADAAPIPESEFDRSIAHIGNAAPPADWPKLVIQHVRIPYDDMISVCAKAWKNPSAPGRACALIVFKSSTCYIVDSIEFPMSPYIRHHEEQHCGGRDHIGESTIRDAWEKWKSEQ